MTRTTLRSRALSTAVAAALLTGAGLAGAAPAMADAVELDVSNVTVTITGTPKVGNTLTVTTDGWPAGTELSYQWTAGGGNFGGPIQNATGTSYVVTSAEIGLWVGIYIEGSLDGFENNWVNAAHADVAFVDQQPAGAAPVADSSQLPGYLAGVEAQQYSADEVDLPTGDIDPSQDRTANVPWFNADSYVDVYAYSSPVRVGTFPVVGGYVQVPLSSGILSSLGKGAHTLVLTGQSSGRVSAVSFRLAETLAATGVSPAAGPAALAALAFVLGGAVLVMRRRKDVAA